MTKATTVKKAQSPCAPIQRVASAGNFCRELKLEAASFPVKTAAPAPKGPAKNKFPFSGVEAPAWQGARSEEYQDI